MHPLWGEAHFQVKMCKQTPGSEHFLKLRRRESARRCGAKHISKSKVEKTEGFSALLDVRMLFCAKSEQNVRAFAQFQLQPLHSTTLHYILQLQLPLQLQLHYITLRYTKYITLHHTTSHYTTVTLHHTRLHYATLPTTTTATTTTSTPTL